jgi:WD40 repeat protein
VIGAAGILWQWRRAEANYAETRALLYAANMKLAEAAWDEGNIRAVKQLLAPFDAATGPIDLRGWEWHFLHRLCHQDALTVKGEGRVVSITETPATGVVVVGTFGQRVWTFDPNTGSKQLDVPRSAHVIAAALSTDKKILAVLEESGAVELTELVPSQQSIARFNIQGEVSAGAFTTSLAQLAAAGRDNKVRICDMLTGTEARVLEGHTAKITSVEYSMDETRLLTGSQDGTIRIWDLATGQTIQCFEHPAKPWLLCASLSRNGKLLAAGGEDNAIIVWDTASRRELLRLEGHTDVVESVAFSPDEKFLASGSADRTIRVWELPSGLLWRTIRGHLERVSKVAFRGHSRIISGSSDETVRLWNLHSDDIYSPHPREVNVKNALFSDDGSRLACRFVDGSVVVFDVSTWAELLRFAGPSAGGAMAYDSRRNGIAVSAEDGGIELWTDGRRVRRFSGHAAKIESLALSNDGKWLASGSEDRTLKLWDTEAEKLKYDAGKHTRDVTAVAFSPDSKLLFSAVDTDVSVWDAATGKPRGSFKEHPERVFNFAFNRSGNLIATGDRSGTIIVWNPTTGQRQATLAGHTDRAYACCFSPDARRLASCSRDGTIRWWDLTTARELCVIKGDWGALEWITLSPDGWTLVAINEAREMRVWDPRP